MDTSWLIPLLTIIGIDLVLAGDNAIVIGMASRNLPPDQRKKAVMWGTVGAVVIRVGLTFIAVFLLKIPLLMAVGGLLLCYVAIQLMNDDNDEEEIQGAANLYQAIKTIVVADIIMGLDNVLAIAGASHGNFWLIVVGLAISIPIVVWGSQIISTFMNRYPILVYVGALIIAYTAASMIIHDSIIQGFIPDQFEPVVGIVITLLVVAIGWWLKTKKGKEESKEETKKIG